MTLTTFKTFRALVVHANLTRKQVALGNPFAKANVDATLQALTLAYLNCADDLMSRKLHVEIELLANASDAA